jgi:hypothetical protein
LPDDEVELELVFDGDGLDDVFESDDEPDELEDVAELLDDPLSPEVEDAPAVAFLASFASARLSVR